MGFRVLRIIEAFYQGLKAFGRERVRVGLGVYDFFQMLQQPYTVNSENLNKSQTLNSEP